MTSSQQGKQDLVDDFEPVKIIKLFSKVIMYLIESINFLHLPDKISPELCKNKKCGDSCGISPFGARYRTKDLSCILLPFGPKEKDCGGIILLF